MRQLKKPGNRGFNAATSVIVEEVLNVDVYKYSKVPICFLLYCCVCSFFIIPPPKACDSIFPLSLINCVKDRMLNGENMWLISLFATFHFISLECFFYSQIRSVNTVVIVLKGP